MESRPDRQIFSLLQRARNLLSDAGIKDPLFESELILAHLLGIERYKLYVEPHFISRTTKENFFFIVSKRANHVPLAYLLKRVFFSGYRFYISKGVFIPRPETETIINCVCNLIEDRNKPINILDICTGCGVLAIVCAKLFPESSITGTDISKKALSIASRNACLHKVQSRVTFLNADIIPETLNKKFSLIVSNPPYLTMEEIECGEEIKKEPFIALYGGRNGMEIIYRILSVAGNILTKDGFLIMEVSPSQIKYFQNLKCSGLSLVSVCKDVSGTERVVVLKNSV